MKPTLRQLGLLIALIPIATSARAFQSVPPEFVQLEEAWNAAHRNGDAAALDRLWADDLEVHVPRMASMSKAEALAFMRTGRMRFDRYDSTLKTIRLYKDIAVVTGRLQRTRTVGDTQRHDDWVFTKVYARINGSWRVVSFHASDGPTP